MSHIPKRQLGANGPMVGAIGFGGMSIAGAYGPTNIDDGLAALDAAHTAGIDFWDTANIYGMGQSETIMGQYLAQSGADVVLATKASIVPGPPRHYRNDADHLRSELEQSLTRLGRDKVELFYIHRREAERPIEEVVETLAGFIAEGLIDGYGLSEVAPYTIRRAHAVHPCRAVQNEYSLWSRMPELGVIQACADLGVAFIPFSPLGRGAFGHHFPPRGDMGAGDLRKSYPRFTEPNYSANRQAVEAFGAFAASRGWTVPAAALAWVLDRDPDMIPIPGTRHAAHVGDWLAACDIAFTDADRAEIARLLPPGFAHGDRYNDAHSIGPERFC